MREHQTREDDVIELGDVSVETKGNGMIDQDVGVTPLNFAIGIVVD